MPTQDAAYTDVLLRDAATLQSLGHVAANMYNGLAYFNVLDILVLVLLCADWGMQAVYQLPTSILQLFFLYPPTHTHIFFYLADARWCELY